MKSSVAIVGAGYMGGGMAQVFALAGHQTFLADVDFDTARRGRDRMLSEAELFEKDDLFEAGSVQRIAENVRVARSIEEAVEYAHYVAEVVFENREIKASALGRISQSAADQTIIGSNTSAIPISELAASVRLPRRFLGVHWMNPAPFVPCVELIPVAETDTTVIDAVEAIISGLGKATSRVSDSAGFVANRLQFALFREAALLAQENIASREEIDRIVSNSFGFRLPFFGPFDVADMAGLDVYAGAYESLERTFGNRFSKPDSLKMQVDGGKLGFKSGEGYRKYSPQMIAEMTMYRNRAYVELERLRAKLGPPPHLRAEDTAE
jgi:3-hydroxybutyryl-CoA dehydrogenase